MAVTDAQLWLRGRLPGVPNPLRARLEEVLGGDSDPGPPAEVFGRLAGTLIRELRSGRSGDKALTLLAADALMTYACEARSQGAPETLAEIS